MSAVKHLTLGPGWGGYTFSVDTRGVAPAVSVEKAHSDDQKVYEALLKRMEEESKTVSQLPPAESAHANGDPN